MGDRPALVLWTKDGELLSVEVFALACDALARADGLREENERNADFAISVTALPRPSFQVEPGVSKRL